MQKVKLELEHLQVESFETDMSGAKKGTVQAHQLSAWQDCAGHSVGQSCATVYPGEWGCENTGVASCAWCPAETQTCQDCSWTGGGEVMCYW